LQLPRTVSLLGLSLALLRLGAFAFGGMGGTLALLRSDLGARRGWITDQDVAEALAITQTLPGSTGVQVVAFLGWKLAGWPGALIAPFSFVAVPAAMMIAASAAVMALPDIPAIRGALLGIQIAIVSNTGWDVREVFIAHRLDRFVSAYVLSYEVGAVKPAAAIFEFACDALGLPPTECLMVGDDAGADSGAVSAGMRVLLVPARPPGADNGVDAAARIVTGV